MQARDDLQTLVTALRQQGVSRADARSIARQWLEHRCDIEQAAIADGFPAAHASDYAQSMMGSTRQLALSTAAVVSPGSGLMSLPPSQLAAVARWGSACAGGLLTTAGLFVAMTLAISI